MSGNSHLIDSLRTFYNRETGALNVLGLLHNSVAYATPKLLSFLKMPGIDSHPLKGSIRPLVLCIM